MNHEDDVHEQQCPPLDSRWTVAIYITVAIGLAVIGALELMAGNWYGGALAVLVALPYGMIPGTRASAFELGWLLGRGAMLHALIEAHQRQMPFDTFLEAEVERDLNGVPSRPEERP